MAYFFFAFLGMVCGGVGVYFIVEARRKQLEHQRRRQEAMSEQLAQGFSRCAEEEKLITQKYETLRSEQAAFDSKVVAYTTLVNENAMLKSDLVNLNIVASKHRLDTDLHRQRQMELNERSHLVAKIFLRDSLKWIMSSLNASNYVLCKQRLTTVIERCRSIGFDISDAEELAMVSNLKDEYEKVVKLAIHREEQARIRAQIREEQVRQKEIERARIAAEAERAAIQAALTVALASAQDQHSAEIEELRTRLAEAEDRSVRAISQAQLTRSGHIYVISNLGSFGEDVFKIGMTRRLEPLDRIRELGDASVPFYFDVHMMIASDDAPSLENALHKALHRHRINKANPRKEFFRTDLESIVQIVKEHHGEVEYVADVEALQYRQSLTMSAEDQDFIEEVFEEEDDLAEVLE